MSYTYERGKGTTEKSKAFAYEMISGEGFDIKLKKGEVFRYQGELVRVDSISSVESIKGTIIVRGKCKRI